MLKVNQKRPHLRDTETPWQKFWKSFAYGSKPEIVDCSITGRITPSLKASLTRKINGLLLTNGSVKIGKTGDGYIRSDYRDYRSAFTQMHLLFRSKSETVITQLEELYISKYMASHPEQIANRRAVAPGKRMYSYNGYYYLYAVTAPSDLLG